MVIGVVSQTSKDHELYVNADISTVIAMLNRNHIAFDLAEDRMQEEEPSKTRRRAAAEDNGTPLNGSSGRSRRGDSARG